MQTNALRDLSHEPALAIAGQKHNTENLGEFTTGRSSE